MCLHTCVNVRSEVSNLLDPSPSQAVGSKGMKMKPDNLSQLARAQRGDDRSIDQLEIQRFENEKLREELDRMQHVLGQGHESTGTTRGAAEERERRLTQENAKLKEQIKIMSSDRSVTLKI